MSYKIHLSLCHMGGDEQQFVQQAISDNWVVPLGPNVDAFEEKLNFYFNDVQQSEYYRTIALNSGTAAIHLALILLGVTRDDEVICQSFTYIASANPALYLGARLVFVDSERLTWNLDPDLLDVAIKDRLSKTGKLPKAIIVVHLYGMPAQMDAICDIARKYGIVVIEDAAEALGSEINGRKCGTWGKLAALSFNGNKIITTSAGGALICSTDAYRQKAIYYATQARLQAPYYLHSEVGYNYRMSNICASIGLGQWNVFDGHLKRRRDIHKLYIDLLHECKGIKVMDNPSLSYNSNFWLTCILIDPLVAGVDCESIRISLECAGIESRRLWKPMHLQPIFIDSPFYGSNTCENIFEWGLCLPSSSILTDLDIETVVKVIKENIK